MAVPVGGSLELGERQRAFLLVVGTGLLWGTIGVASKLVYETTTLDAVSLNWLRTLVASVACLAIAGPGLARGLRRSSRRDLALMVLLGIVLIVYQWCYLAAIDRLGVAVATLIALCVPPALVALVSALFLGEALTRTLVLALAGSLLGTALLVGAPTPVAGAGSDAVLIGVLLALAGLGALQVVRLLLARFNR